MKYSMQIGKYTSVSKQSIKDAYIKATRWFYEKMMTVEQASGIHVEFRKLKGAEYPTVEAIVYIALDEQEVKDNNCSVCRETHNAFYFNYDTSCSSCIAEAYRKRMQDRLKVKAAYVKECMDRSSYE